jgi:hypothetical protein
LLRKFAIYNGNVFKLHDPKGIKDIWMGFFSLLCF